MCPAFHSEAGFPGKVYQRTIARLARVRQLFEKAKVLQETEFAARRWDPSDFSSHLMLEACVAFGAGALEYYVKNVLRWALDLPRNAGEPEDLRVRTTPEGFVTDRHRFWKLYKYDEMKNWILRLLGIDPGTGLSQDQVALISLYALWRHLTVHNNAEIDERFLKETKDIYDSYGVKLGEEWKGRTFLLDYGPIGPFLDAVEELVTGVQKRLPLPTADEP